MPTKIEWCEETWNPVTGCTPVSEGCRNCYARRMAHRLHGRFGYPKDDPFAVTLHLDKLDKPLHWRKPRRVFVCSMGDLFHKDVPLDYILRVFKVMARTPRHTYMILTKRPERMQRFLMAWEDWKRLLLPHVWLGVSVENEKHLNRLDYLRATPAAVRFISFEPLLGPMPRLDLAGIHWVIVGAETGPGARLMLQYWADGVKEQCQDARVPFFFKRRSDGSRLLGGREWNEYPSR